MIQTAVFGRGNIGSGVVQIIEENREQISKAIPGGMDVKYILDLRDFPGTFFEKKVVHDIDIILSDPEISVICETMGGKEPAFTFTRKALEKGISVCTSNKELVEAFGPELIRIAKEHNCSYLFEASVGGGIPLLTPLIQCLCQEEIESIMGILNGTTNYILTKMERFGQDYESALKEAQELGYAERNPAADVEGHDTGRKTAILASLMCGKTVRYTDEKVEGITGVTPQDFVYAGHNDYTIKLIGMTKRDETGLSLMTAPFLIPREHPLFSIQDVFNGVLVHGNMVDDLMFYGRGAGKLPTGSAVVADMILAAKHQGETIPIPWDGEVLQPLSADDYSFRRFVLVSADEKSQAEELFAGEIDAIWSSPDAADDFAFVTSCIEEKRFSEKIGLLPCVKSTLRILD